MIGLPNSPSQYDPTVNPDLALSRRNKVLDNMLRLGHITQEEHDAAQAEPITLNVTEISGSGVDVYSQPTLSPTSSSCWSRSSRPTCSLRAA